MNLLALSFLVLAIATFGMVLGDFTSNKEETK